MVGVCFMCTALSLTDFYLQTKFHFNPLRYLSTFKGMALTGIPKLRGNNSVNRQGRIMVYVLSPSCILISLVTLSKIWPGQASVMKNGYGEIKQS